MLKRGDWGLIIVAVIVLPTNLNSTNVFTLYWLPQLHGFDLHRTRTARNKDTLPDLPREQNFSELDPVIIETFLFDLFLKGGVMMSRVEIMVR